MTEFCRIPGVFYVDSTLSSTNSLTLNSGKVLGGSSAINGLTIQRGSREDYDAWGETRSETGRSGPLMPYSLISSVMNAGTRLLYQPRVTSTQTG